MPCYRCDARQTDPARGASPWDRGVVGGEQVLVCPACQRDPDWRRALDQCVSCGSTRLAKALGLVVCRACGTRTEPRRDDEPRAAIRDRPPTEPGSPLDPGNTAVSAGLAADVDAALARMFRRTTSVGRPPNDAVDR
jgi:hypothetical protein